MDEPINFCENRFHYLSPFSAHRIEIWSETFATVEHAYQASRILPSKERESVKRAPSPMDAWREGQKYKNDPKLAVPDFNKDAVMEELFRAKIAQHPDIVIILKESGDRGLLKIYATDYYWGTGADGSGENRMGKLWMKLRNELAMREIFLEAREIPYRIPLTFEERNDACVGKHFLIKDRLEALGYKVRWAECTFNWKDIGVPESILAIEHGSPDLHVWLEVWIDGGWQTIDATWDSALGKTLHINRWEDFGKMKPAVPVLTMIPYEEVVVTREPPEDYRAQLEKERPFLQAINEWFGTIRK